ncbi:SDR family oxidoreductase [Streptomyces sp. NPDC058464]|uniref:SDR family oxidoreductase n=1 Tax=Streptomyces sp. NPDC058464 TaxID=3346511 RepID=UPI0036537654
MNKAREVAVVVGSGSIGLAIARRVGNGRTLLLADYSEKALDTASDLLSGEGYDVTTRVTDVSDSAAVAALADAAAELGPVTQVVHTAGVSPVQAPTERVLHVDLLGTALVLDEFARVIASGGAGVVISSMAGHMQSPYVPEIEHALANAETAELLSLPFLQPDQVGNSGAAYALSKRANALRVQAMAVAWGKRAARVNCISPGIILTPLARDEMSGPGSEGYRRMIETSAAKRVGTPDEVAEAAAFLLGRQAGFITGADLLMDGGVIAALRTGELSLTPSAEG